MNRSKQEDNETIEDDFLLVRELLPRESTLDQLFNEFLDSLQSIMTSDVVHKLHRDVQQYTQEVFHNILSHHRLKVYIPAASYPLPFASSAFRPSSHIYPSIPTQKKASVNQNITQSQYSNSTSNPRNNIDENTTVSSNTSTHHPNDQVKEMFLDAHIPILKHFSSNEPHENIPSSLTLLNHKQNNKNESDLVIERRILDTIFRRPSQRFQDRILEFFRDHLKEISKQHQSQVFNFRETVKNEFRSLSEEVFQQYLERKRFIERECGQNINSLRTAMSKNYLFGRRKIEELENQVKKLENKNREMKKIIKSIRDELDKSNSAYRNMEAANMSLRSQNHDLIEQSRYSNVEHIMDVLEILGVPKETSKNILRKKNGLEIARKYKLEYDETLNEATNHYADYKMEKEKVQELQKQIKKLESENANVTNELELEKKRNTELRKENYDRTQALERLEMETFGHSDLSGKSKDGTTISEQLEDAKNQIKELEEKLTNKEQENHNLIHTLHQMKLDLLDKEAEFKEKESLISQDYTESSFLNPPSNPSHSSSNITSQDADKENVSVFSHKVPRGVKSVPRRPHSVTGSEYSKKKIATTFTVTNGFKRRPRSAASSRFGNLYRAAKLGGSPPPVM